jgi:hypothetical protein
MKAFERIINQAIASAENVECDGDEFKLGLCSMLHTLRARIELEGINPEDPEVLERVDQLEGA